MSANKFTFHQSPNDVDLQYYPAIKGYDPDFNKCETIKRTKAKNDLQQTTSLIYLSSE